MTECHFHQDEPAIADLEVGVDDVPACAGCAADALAEGWFAVAFRVDVLRRLAVA